MSQIRFTKAEFAFVRRRKKLPRRQIQAEFVEKCGREVSLTSIKDLCKRMGWRNGRDCRFHKGMVAPNKGKKIEVTPNTPRLFRKGNLPPCTKYAGYERVNKDGYIEISVNETDPRSGFERRFVLKHRWLWKEMHGPIPKGMVLKCKAGDRLNTAPSNWALVPNGVLSGLNARGYEAAPDELKPTIMAVAKLEHQLSRKRSVAAAGGVAQSFVG